MFNLFRKILRRMTQLLLLSLPLLLLAAAGLVWLPTGPAANCNSASLPTCVKKQRRRQNKKASQFRVLAAS